MDKAWSSYIEHTYGLSVAEYNKLLKEQNGLCAICGKPPNGKRLSIDHHHRNGRVRGLLFMHCNVILGHAFEKIKILEGALAYMRKHHEIDIDWDMDLFEEKLKACGI